MLTEIIRRRQSVIGLLSGTMSRDVAFQFMRLGRNIERADMTTRMLDVNYAINLPYQNSQYYDRIWMSMLHALSAHQMYRRHVGVHVRGHKVLGFLLNDLHFPRSVRHCLHEIQFALGELPGAEPMRRLQACSTWSTAPTTTRWRPTGCTNSATTSRCGWPTSTPSSARPISARRIRKK